MHPVISIGKQNFASLRENNCFYIDKSDLIREWWESQDEITLITRPRRFGKTLNMSMLNNFFSNLYTDKKKLFEDLSVWKEEKYQTIGQILNCIADCIICYRFFHSWILGVIIQFFKASSLTFCKAVPFQEITMLGICFIDRHDDSISCILIISTFNCSKANEYHWICSL